MRLDEDSLGISEYINYSSRYIEYTEEFNRSVERLDFRQQVRVFGVLTFWMREVQSGRRNEDLEYFDSHGVAVTTIEADGSLPAVKVSAVILSRPFWAWLIHLAPVLRRRYLLAVICREVP